MTQEWSLIICVAMHLDDEIKNFLEHFDYDVPNPEHEPRRFEYYVRMYRYYKERQRRNEESTSGHAGGV